MKTDPTGNDLLSKHATGYQSMLLVNELYLQTSLAMSSPPRSLPPKSSSRDRTASQSSRDYQPQLNKEARCGSQPNLHRLLNFVRSRGHPCYI